jgi:hypothetical protein
MSTIINLEQRAHAARLYRELLAESLRRLAAAADTLMEDVVNLAMLGPWSEWSEEQQVGAVSVISPEALAGSGDPRVATLTGALVAMRHAIEELDTDAG